MRAIETRRSRKFDFEKRASAVGYRGIPARNIKIVSRGLVDEEKNMIIVNSFGQILADPVSLEPWAAVAAC